MRNIIRIVVGLGMLSFGFLAMAEASPFLVCDPQATVTHYKITGDAFWTGNIPAQADGSLRTDLATIPVGVHTVQAVACRTGDGWPEVCSGPTLPFSFVRPGVPVIPGGVKLLP